MTQNLKIEDINCSGGGPSVGPPGPWGQGSLRGGSARVSTSQEMLDFGGHLGVLVGYQKFVKIIGILHHVTENKHG